MTHVRRAAGALAVVLAGLPVPVLAAAVPTVVAAPLDVPRAPSADAASDLNRALKGLIMREPDVLTPTPSAWEGATGQLKRKDCGVADACLQELAVAANTLYAVYASVDLDLTRSKVIAIGRIVRRDGVLVEVNGERAFKAEVERRDRPFEVAAKEALAKLIAKMKLASLLPSLPAAEAPRPAPTAAPPPEPLAATVAPPAPTVSAQPSATAGVAGKIVFGLGLALVAGGSVTFGVGQARAAALTPTNGNLPLSQLDAYHSAVTLRPAGLALAGAGVAAAVIGLVVWLTSGAASDAAEAKLGVALGVWAW